MSAVVQWYKNHWNGTAPLWSAFWLHWVSIPAVLTIAGILALEGMVQFSEIEPFVGTSLIILAYIYQVSASLLVWRCSISRENQPFGFIARVLALSGPFMIGLNLISIGFASLVVGGNV